jgi:hypothetical protein
VTGDHYYSAHISSGGSISGSSKVGEYIQWNQPSATISRIGLSVRRITSGSIVYHLEKVGSGDVATGTLNTSSLGTANQGWAYASLSTPVTLQQGQAYRLYFTAPSGSYYSACVYGENRPANWLTAGWVARRATSSPAAAPGPHRPTLT